MDMKETRIGGEQIYDGIIVHLYKDDVTLPNGKTAVREVIRHQGAVCVVAIDNEENIYLVKQFRYPFNDIITEIPAGKLDAGETPLEGAARELREETGIVANNYLYLGELYTSPAFLDEVIHMYLATDLTFVEQDPDEDEFVEVEKIKLNDFVKEIMNGKIPDSKTQTAVLKAYLSLQSNS
ncbi:MAG: NUDIX hydrolase [Ruminococcaceae bacterium]|nr:NUDIX hydrolase [Oscillospiraceae bacterium]